MLKGSDQTMHDGSGRSGAARRSLRSEGGNGISLARIFLFAVAPCVLVFAAVVVGSLVIVGECPAPHATPQHTSGITVQQATKPNLRDGGIGSSAGAAHPREPCPVCKATDALLKELPTAKETCPKCQEPVPCPEPGTGQSQCELSTAGRPGSPQFAGPFGAVTETESWRRFGTMTTHAKQCNDGFGFSLVHSWRAKGDVWCGTRGETDPRQLGGAFTPQSYADAKATIDKPTPLGSTRFACYKLRQHRHTGDDNFCVGEGFKIDVSLLQRQAKEPHIFTFDKGAMQGTCTPDTSKWHSGGFTMWQDGWFNSYSTSPPGAPLQCDATIDEMTVFVSRDNWKHLYWQTGTFFNLFVAYNVLGVQPDDVRIVLLDYWPLGPFEAIMQKAFSNINFKVQSIQDLAKSKGVSSLCFRRALFNLPEYSAAIVKGRPNGDDCSHSELVRAYASHVATRLGAISPMTDADNLRPTKVVFNSRRNYDGRTLLRQLTNEQELVDRLKQSHPAVEVEQVDFAQLSFEQQILKAGSADIMIGMHGSGLAHCMFMPEDGILIEITEANGNLKTFRNLCKWSGKTYIAFPFTSGGTSAVKADPEAFERVTSATVLIAQSYYNRIAVSSTVAI